MRSRRALVIIGAALALLLIPVAAYVYRRVRPDFRSPSEFTVNPANAAKVRSLQKQLLSRPMTDADVQELRALANDSDELVRTRAITAFLESGAGRSKSALDIARPMLRDPSWLVRDYALRAMYQFKAPDRRDIAAKLANDPSPEVRRPARALLESDER